jgi:MFS_1 like family
MLLTFSGSVLVRSALALATKSTSIVWLYVIVACSAVLNAPVKPLMDSAVMSMLSDKSDYGRSRLYGQIGFGLGSYIVGPLISKDIKLIFLMQLLFAVPTSVLMAGFQPTQSEKKKENLDVLAAVNHMIALHGVSHWSQQWHRGELRIYEDCRGYLLVFLIFLSFFTSFLSSLFLALFRSILLHNTHRLVATLGMCWVCVVCCPLWQGGLCSGYPVLLAVRSVSTVYLRGHLLRTCYGS